MNTRKISLRITAPALIILTAALFICSCSDDDPVRPDDTDTTGTIVVDILPEDITPDWTLELPDGETITGMGDTTMTDMAAGSYTITWLHQTDWITPDPATATLVLEATRTVTFTGAYVLDFGTIIINPEPDGVNTYWLLARGDEVGGIAGSGDDTLSFQMPEDYTVTWGDVPGWLTPDPETLAVTSPDTTTFTGTYEVDTAAYPTPRINWIYENAPIPEGFPMIVWGGANDEQDGPLGPESLTWTSDLDGVLVVPDSELNTGDLSVGVHEIRLRAVDSHGLAAEDTVTIEIVVAPVLSPTTTLTLPDWGVYDVAQSSSDSPLFGWDGVDPDSGSGHPAYVRFRFLPALLPDGETYATTRIEVEANLDFLISFADLDWSDWLPYSEVEAERRLIFEGLGRLDNQGAVIHYLFVIQSWSETGAIEMELIYSGNMAHFYIEAPK